jgi:hypothetical protein
MHDITLCNISALRSGRLNPLFQVWRQVPALFCGEYKILLLSPPKVCEQALGKVAGLGNTRRQIRELILGPCLDTKARFLAFNRRQSRAVSGLLTGHNTARRHLYLMGLSDSPLFRRCREENETSAHIFVSVKPCLH